MIARLETLLAEHPLARRVLGAQEPEVLPQLLELPSLQELRAQLAREIAAAQTAGTARTDIDPELVAHGLETIVLTMLMASVHVPSETPRAAAVIAVLDAAIRP